MESLGYVLMYFNRLVGLRSALSVDPSLCEVLDGEIDSLISQGISTVARPESGNEKTKV